MSAHIRKQPTATARVAVSYAPLLAELKERVRAAQLRAATSVARELNQLYWEIGRAIARAQASKGHGKKVVERLSADLRSEFPGMAGFSPQNLWYMRAFYLGWSGGPANSPAAAGESGTPDSLPAGRESAESLPADLAGLLWMHNVALLTKLKKPEERLWYARAALQYGWSRAVLTVQIELQAHRRLGQAATNFARTLPPPQSDLAQQVLKDPYTFDFLMLPAAARERHLEQGLTDHIQRFLVDEQMRHPDDQPTIGLLLCKEKNRLTVKYALREMKRPIGVAEWKTRLVESLPRKLRGALPSVVDLAKGLGGENR